MANNTRRIDLAALRDFVLQRLRPEGGFAATPMQPHTIQDTFFAIDILSCLPAPGPGDHCPSLAGGATGRYLRDYVRAHPAMPVKTAFQVHCLARLLDMPLHPRWRTGGEGSGLDYEEAWYAAVLTNNGTAAPSDFKPARRTVRQLYFFLKLQQPAHTGRMPANAGKLALWLRRCQAPDGGFGFFPGTTSYIENSHYALAGLAMLQSQPARPDRAAAFLLSCQTACGGFSRNTRAAPFLDASWHAVRASRHLGLLAAAS